VLFVKTKIGLSKIHGIGLFSDQFIKKGTLIWKYQSGFDVKIHPSDVNYLNPHAKKSFLKYAYLNRITNRYILCFDDARFFNHSDFPNCNSVYPMKYEEGVNYAVSDILSGEELTCNYDVFDAESKNKLIK